MNKDKDFEKMLDHLDIVVESLEEDHTIITPRVDQIKRRRTLLDLQSNLLDSKFRQHALYQLYFNSTFRKFSAGILIVSFLYILKH